MEWALDLILIVLLTATLFHAMRLERALGVLKRDRAALEELVRAFNASTLMAEQGIERLRNSADNVGSQITRQIDVASSLKNDLLFLSERGERLADRMEVLVRSGSLSKQVSSVEAQNLARFAALELQPSRERVSLLRHEQPVALGNDAPLVRLRSQAERDLLKALKLAR